MVGFFSTARFVHWSVLWPPTILKASQFDSGGSHQSKLLEFPWNHDCYSRDGGAHSRISLPKMPNPKELERTALVYELRNISQLENQGWFFEPEKERQCRFFRQTSYTVYLFKDTFLFVSTFSSAFLLGPGNCHDHSTCAVRDGDRDGDGPGDARMEGPISLYERYKNSGWLGYIGDYTRLYRDYDKPL